MSQEPERGPWQEKGGGGGKEVGKEKGSRKGTAGRKPRANGERILNKRNGKGQVSAARGNIFTLVNKGKEEGTGEGVV